MTKVKKFYETEEFKKIEKEWKEKLKKDGFEDAEQEDGNLKKWTSHYFKVRHSDVRAEARQLYYEYATQFLHEHRFQNERDRIIWEHHASGLSMEKIGKLLGLSAKPVFTTIQRLSKIMRINFGF